MFSILALVEVTVPAVGALLEERAVSVSELPARGRKAQTAPKLSPSFVLLVTANLMGWTGAYSTLMVRSVHMNSLGFSLAAITSVIAVNGAVSLPLPPIVGRLSDRLGRKRLLTLGYLAGAAGRAVLAWAASLWHFWAAAAMGAVAGASSSVGQAMATDLVPPESLGWGMSLFHSSMWVGAIVGFTATGYAVEVLGAAATFWAGAVLSLIAACALIPIGERSPTENKAATGDGVLPAKHP
jgi:DHA1 family multidrug resistance protein-like MFS transporter